ncbi:MAG: molybdopterin biosynthesis protein [Pirellulaceae bacterium]|nr:molybdopterin biosynthesis protein [Pirellulaceae bacterium]
MSKQDQFLDVIDRDEAEARFRKAIVLEPVGSEEIALSHALGRVLCEDIVADIDVPSFDRSNLDGFAIRAKDTFGAREDRPHRLQLLEEVISTAVIPTSTVEEGQAVSIATGAMIPRGADAIVMVEHTDTEGVQLIVRQAVTAGFGVAFAGTDIASGETILRQGDLLTSRETGVLAAIGRDRVSVWRRPRVGILSTGDEIIEPGETMQPGRIFDSNARIVADSVKELGGEPIELGIVHDDLKALRVRLAEALTQCDVVVLSGGTSKGTGDLSYRVVRELKDPGIVAHGVALKPGKPICLAASQGKPVVILPGFPTSAIFTFHEFLAPVIQQLAGQPQGPQATVGAQMAVKVNSEIGRTEFLLVGLVAGNSVSPLKPNPSTLPPIAAYPMGKGSGSVTTFSRADGFVTIERHEEIVEAGAPVKVRLFGRDLQIADLIVIGSHCIGLDFLLGQLQQKGFRTKFLAVGSTAGLEAAKRGECDVAGVHLLDRETGEYNRPFLTKELELHPGYGRLQGVVYRKGDERFENQPAKQAIRQAGDDESCLMVNRNQGSGTRILIDQLLSGIRPNGYAIQSRSHNAVAASVHQGRADWGVAIQSVARPLDLGFLPLHDEQFDFVIPASRTDRPAVIAFRELLNDLQVREHLTSLGLPASLRTQS